MGRVCYQVLAAMEEFIGERIEVEKAETLPGPVRFSWRGELHEVVKVLGEWVDAGFGELPARSGRWYNRRHRRYYVVRDTEGCVFEIYLDYANRRKPTWWLARRLE
jgi:hypothetical protein